MELAAQEKESWEAEEGSPLGEEPWAQEAAAVQEHAELAESQLAEGNPLSRPKQSSKGGSDRSDDPTQLKPKGGESDEGQRRAST